MERKASFLLLAKQRPGLETCVDFLKTHSGDVQVFVGKRGDPFPTSLLDWRGKLLLSYISPWIVPAALLERASFAAINFHPGTPNYPGIGCTNFAIYNRENQFGVTAHHMVEQVDTGPIIAVKRFPLREEDTVWSLTHRCYENLVILFQDVISHFFATGRLPKSAEKWTRRPYTRCALDALCEINMTMTPEEVERRIRATTYPGMPGAYWSHPREEDAVMSKYMKGNYPLPEGGMEPAEKQVQTATEEFERRALERLGGSISFVLKKNTFVWKGDPPKGS